MGLQHVGFGARPNHHSGFLIESIGTSPYPLGHDIFSYEYINLLLTAALQWIWDKIQWLKVRLELQATLAAHDACRREILQKPSNFDGKTHGWPTFSQPHLSHVFIGDFAASIKGAVGACRSVGHLMISMKTRDFTNHNGRIGYYWNIIGIYYIEIYWDVWGYIQIYGYIYIEYWDIYYWDIIGIYWDIYIYWDIWGYIQIYGYIYIY